MKIRNRLTLRFSLIVSSIILVFSSVVYLFSVIYQNKEFERRLENNAVNTALMFFEIQGIDANQLNIIERTVIYFLGERKVMIFGPEGEVLFATPSGTIMKENIDKILPMIRKGESVFSRKGKIHFVGFIYRFQNTDYKVIARAIDNTGREGNRNLLFILIFGDLFTIVITFFAGYFYSDKALKPMSQIVNQVNSITSSHIDTRVTSNSKNDEIAILAETFNKMLDRLQEAFELQQGFVSNASHGIRTPLTSIFGQIETALFKKRTTDEYEAILKSIHNDIRRLTNLSNSLLYLAQSSTDIEKLLVQKVRIDEVLLQAQTEVELINKNYTIITDFDQLPEEEDRLTIYSNENLLKMIFFNLMDNACKYSDDHKVYATINFSDKETIIHFIDHGRGISKFDQKNIFEPFYRGANTSDTKGHGMGLSLVKKILDLHQVRIGIQSQLGSGTTVSLYFRWV